MLPVHGSVKNYHWGKIGNDSYIARFQAVAVADCRSNGSQSMDNMTSQKFDAPLAELWFGSHPSGPCFVTVDKQYIRLDTFLSKQPEMVGSIELYHKHDKKLPFLFKILAVDQSLSLQAHPDKKLAQVLHIKDPKNYPDSNHKPELAIALTEFEVLCDFRPHIEIVNFMKHFAPLRQIVGEKNAESYIKLVSQNDTQDHRQIALAECFKHLMTRDKESVTKSLKDLLLDHQDDGLDQSIRDLIKLVGQLNKLYPGDPSVFAPFFLNYLKLTPGQAIYLKANKLHSYLKGECIECMSCSDNVVRAGLTSKYRDIETLINMLDYHCVKSSNDILLTGIKHVGDPSVVTFAPTEEFKVDKIVVSPSSSPNGEYTLSSMYSGSFIVVLGGTAKTKDFFNSNLEHKMKAGSAGFIPPKIALKLYNIHGTLIIYRSYS